MHKWGWRLISRIGALALLGFFLLLISLPNLIDLENFRPQLLAYMESRISGEVAVGKLKLTFRNGPGLRVDGIRVFDKSGVQQISVATAIINFDLKRLFKRRFHLCRVTLVQPRVVLQDDTAIFPLVGFLRPAAVLTNPKNKCKTVKVLPERLTDYLGENVGRRESIGFFRAWRFDADVSQALVEIIDGSVVFTDHGLGRSPILTHLEELNSLFEWHKFGAPAEFTLTARVVDKQGDGSLNIEGSLSALRWPLCPDQMFLDCQVDAENLNAATYFPYYQKYVPMRFIGARVDIDSTYRGNLMGLFRSSGRIVLHQAELDYQQVFSQKLKFNHFLVDYDFRLADRYNTIETLKCTIDADGLKLMGHCLLHEARCGIDGTIEAGLEIPEFDPLTVFQLLPWKVMPEKMRSYYQSLQRGGRCVVENAYLKGDYRRIVRLAEKNPPSGVIGGQLKGKNLLFKIADDWPLLAIGDCRAVLESDSLEVSDFDFSWNGLSGEAVNASLRKLYHDPQIKLTAHCREFSPEHLDFLLGQQFPVSGVRVGPSPLDLRLTGDLRHFPDLQLQGTLHLDWSDVELPFIEQSFESLNCLADFDWESIDFKHLLLKRGESDLSFKGDLSKSGAGLGYVLNGQITGTRFLVDDFLPLPKTVSGKEVITEPESGTASGGASITEVKSEEEKETQRLPGLKVNLEGAIKELLLPADSGPGNTSIQRAPWQSFNDFTFSFSGGPETVVKIKECRWRWGEQESQVSVSGELRSFEGLDGELEVAVKDLDLDALFSRPEPKDEGVEEEPQAGLRNAGKVKVALLNELAQEVKADRVETLLSWKEILARHNLHISARAQSLRWQQMTIDEIECDCSFDALGVNFEKFVGRSFGGDLYASAQWRYDDDYFMVDSELAEINFETLNDYLKNPDRGLPMLGGYGSVNFNLDWQGKSLKSWEESLDGQLDFNFHDGRLKKFTMVANVCSLLNLSQFAALRLPKFSIDQGVPYQTLYGKGTIVDGVLEVEEFALRGPAFNLLSSGLISLVDDWVDLEIGVHPLQTVDKLLATIPVVGYIMTGDKKTFVVIPMTARGPLDDIKIKTQTVSGLGKKAISMIQRFFKTPVRLLRMPGKLLNQVGAKDGSGTAAEIDKK